jgi:hypothetical protein
MIFTTSDVSSLAVSLQRWEWAEYGSCALVALGCTGEYIAEFTDCWTGGLKEKRDRLAKRSTLLLISALALELLCLVKTNSISGMLIGSLSEKASTADTKAQSALDKTGLAESKAGEAFAKSNVAKDAAAKAQERVGVVAKEADVIEKQLGKVAKEQLALQWHANLIAKSVSPRLINGKRFTDLMRGQPKASIEIWYEPSDEEAQFLAMQLNSSLGKDGLGWDTRVVPFPDNAPDGFHASSDLRRGD